MQSRIFSLNELWGTISMALDLVKAKAIQKTPPDRMAGGVIF